MPLFGFSSTPFDLKHFRLFTELPVTVSHLDFTCTPLVSDIGTQLDKCDTNYRLEPVAFCLVYRFIWTAVIIGRDADTFYLVGIVYWLGEKFMFEL